jgi:hypothetical protein
VYHCCSLSSVLPQRGHHTRLISHVSPSSRLAWARFGRVTLAQMKNNCTHCASNPSLTRQHRHRAHSFTLFVFCELRLSQQEEFQQLHFAKGLSENIVWLSEGAKHTMFGIVERVLLFIQHQTLASTILRYDLILDSLSHDLSSTFSELFVRHHFLRLIKLK